MKLRIRSMATKETIRIPAPDASSLLDLKAQISAALAATSSNPNPIAPDSIHLSLNQVEELVAPNASDPLSALGLTSGDLLFFSFSPFSQTLAEPNPSEIPKLAPPVSTSGIGSSSNNPTGNTNLETTVNPNPINQSAGPMEVEASDSHLIPSFLMELMDTESKEDTSILSRVVILTHAALLDMNFTLHNGSGSNLPRYWASQASSLCLEYTISDFSDNTDTINEKVVFLKLSVLSNWVTIYGYLSGIKPDVYRFCFDLAKIATLLSSDLNSISKSEQAALMELFHGVKDELSLPLMIDLCLKNGLPLPPCFTSLSIDTKARILDLLPGADVARVGSTCKEMRNLSLDENLWREKMEKEFGNSSNDIRVMSANTWREKYKRIYIARKNIFRYRPRQRRLRSGWPFIIGGDADRFPVFGADVSDVGPGFVGRRAPHGRQFLPRCDFE